MGWKEARKSTWVPDLLFVLSALVLVLAWVQLSDREMKQRHFEMQVRAGNAAARVELFVTTRVEAVVSMRAAWLSPKLEETFDTVAHPTLARFEGLSTIARLDENLAVAQVYPAGATIRVGDGARRAAMLQRTVIGSVRAGADEIDSFNVYVPVVQDGRVYGVVVGVVRVSALLAAMIAEETESLLLRVRQGPQTIGSIGERTKGRAVTTVRASFTLANHTWVITASGPPEPYGLGGWADEALLSGGLLLAFCFFIAIRIVVQRRDELEESEARYRTLVDHAPEAILVLDARTHRVLDANGNAEALFEKTREALLGQDFIELSAPMQAGLDAHVALRAATETAMAGRASDSTWSYRVDDQTLPADLRLVRLPGDPPSLRCGLSPLSERLERERAVRDSEAQLRRILESTNDGVWVADQSGKTSFVNRRMMQILGMERAQFETLTLYDVIVDDDAPTPLPNRASSEKIQHGLRRADGSIAYVVMRNQPITDDADRHIGTLTLVTDLSESRSLEAQLRHAQKMEAIGRLAGGVAHDFNNLLMGILTACELLEPAVDPNDSEALELVEEIRSCGQRAATLTRQLLTFGRKDVAQARPISVAKLVDNVRRILQRVIAETIRLEIHCAEDVGTAFADPVQLEQVLINLAVNASDAMPNGGTLSIRVASASFDSSSSERPVKLASGRYTRITVSDSGEGIRAEHIDKIFDPFFTTKDPGRGTGLGLATVHGTITAIGGAITVDSEVGGGTTFTIFLPESEEDIPIDTPPLRIASRGRETILVVEDEETVRRVLERSLDRAGYDVITADGPAAALRIVEENERLIDLVVSDVVMPDMTGPALVDALMKMQPQLQVLYVSGYAGDHLPNGIAIDEAALLKKPFTAATLTAHVRRRLDSSTSDLIP